MDAYKIYDDYQKICKHEEWIKICIYCGAVLENSEYKTVVETKAGENITEIFEIKWDF